MIMYDTSPTYITSKEHEHNGTYLLVSLYLYILCTKWWGGPDFGNISRIPPTTIRNNETDYDPHLVVTCPEIEYIARLKITHFRTALVLCVAGLWVLPCVLHAMMQ